ncbi:hypothetical protein AQUCO_00300215v1 [Aquilegia coerulea]|uniref:F-box associated beta-propeller type 3 domain-containing protein n=1 Tax=Aquilegia coerulea TaxID=218851 RepID=A0A2G5EXX7_AQUCA|nr:hypothetical protein AQUCO_00300215v1 [Aquilegia coerulea]
MFASKQFYIWNPIIGDYIVLPESPVIHIKPKACGFGFDSITGEYKVIRISKKKKLCSEIADEKKFEAHVYTLGSDSWRVIENVPKFSNTLHSNVFVNGNLHWVSRADDLKLISFNVRTEEFNGSELPPCFKNSKDHMIRDNVRGLAVLEEQLCLIDDHMGIWMMKRLWST